MNNPPSDRQPGLWCSLLGAASAIALTVALRSLTGTKLLAEVVLDATTDSASPGDFSLLLRTLNELARPLLFTSVMLGQTAVYGAAWRATRGIERVEGLPAREAAAVVVAAASLLVATVALGVLSDAGLGTGTSWGEYATVTLVSSGVFALVSRGLEVWDASITGTAVDGSRRRFLGKGPAVVIAIVAVYVAGTRVLSTLKGGTRQGAHPGTPTAEITPTADFYVVSKNLIDPPKVDIDAWRLSLTGAVATPASFTIDAIRALPAVQQYATLQCISNEVGGYLAGTALWKGVLLRDLLNAVQPLGAARHLWFESTDDYTEDLPISFAMLDGVMLAYEMNGAPLTQEHGYPLRLIAPGKYGMKQPKWIRAITLRADAGVGYWARRGWDTEADMQTSSRIDVPADNDRLQVRALRVEGVAFSGRRGIQKVKVSTDGGARWQEATLKPPLSPSAWVLWHYDWTVVPAAGSAVIQARATDGDGVTQTATKAPPFPKGATGYPEVRVTGEES